MVDDPMQTGIYVNKYITKVEPVSDQITYMREKLEMQPEFGLNLDQMHPLRKFMKVFNT